MKELKKLLEELKKSPLFALTLCGKELAHSNFWAWLIEYEINGQHPFIEVFIPGFNKNGYVLDGVKREEGNRDITIHYSDGVGTKSCIIENKLKSMPTIKQLEDYQCSLPDFEQGILTGIYSTLSLNQGWSFLSYQKIASEIQRINDLNRVNLLNDYQIIKRYVEDLNNISEVLCYAVESAHQKAVYDWYNQYYEDLDNNNVRLGDVYLKLVSDSFAKIVNKGIDQKKTILDSRWGLPHAFSSFNRKRATITIVYEEKDIDGNEKGRIGVQIQGNDFRIYAGPSYATSKVKNPNGLYQMLCKCNWLEDCGYNPETIRGKVTSFRGGRGIDKLPYCKYITNDYTHMYQYWNIEKGMLYTELIDQIIKELEKAKDIINSQNISF